MTRATCQASIGHNPTQVQSYSCKQQHMRQFLASQRSYHEVLSDGLQLRARVDVIRAALRPIPCDVLHRIFKNCLWSDGSWVWRLRKIKVKAETGREGFTFVHRARHDISGPFRSDVCCLSIRHPWNVMLLITRIWSAGLLSVAYIQPRFSIWSPRIEVYKVGKTLVNVSNY